MAECESETIAGLWQDYLFLTREMIKFLEKREMKLFYNLLDQREILVQRIKQLDDTYYYASVSGKKQIFDAKQLNGELTQKMVLVYNLSRRQQHTSQAYEGAPSVVGGFFNRQT